VWTKGRKEILTWGSLGRRASAFGNVYRNHHVGTGDVVFIILKHSTDMYSAFLGAMLIGAVPSFLPFPSNKQDSDLYWLNHTAVINRAGSKLLVTYPTLAEDLLARHLLSTFDVVTASDIPTVDDVINTQLPAEASIALLQHSSGTTGLKKAVALSYSAIRLQLEAYADSLGLECDQAIFASWLPLYHDMGLIACFLLPLYLGIPIVSLDAFEWTTRPHFLLEAISEKCATHAWLPNFAFAHITRATPKGQNFELSSLRALIGCSEPNSSFTFNQFQERFKQDGIREHHLQTCYAMAETVFAISQSVVGTAPRRLNMVVENDGVIKVTNDYKGREVISNGPPLAATEVKILREGRLHSEGIAGEICVRSPYMFDGYLNEQGETQSALIEGFFKTGDLGFIFNGEIYILGRIKEVIIINGRNFFASDFEFVTNQIDGVKKGRCVAFGAFLPKIGSEHIVIIAERDDFCGSDGIIIQAISLALNRNFGTTAGDVRLVEQGWLVKTTSGKISRVENARKYVEMFRPEAEIRIEMAGKP
jgi:acyl-CoA synthetase (AMP-forming)/AMP-acid ligase II